MRHCVASYFGTETDIYSLRDKDNVPHCTMEENQQIKGKGNGNINPKYISYVVAFLEEVGMKVGDNEMKNIGYVNIEDLKNDFDFGKLYNDKYFYKEDINKLKNKDDMRLWDKFDIFDFDTSMNVKFNFDLKLSVLNLKKWIKNNLKDSISSGYNATISSGYNAKISSGYNAKISSEDYATISSGYNAKISSGNNSIVVAENKSIVKAKIGTVITLIERDNNLNIIDFASAFVDGKNIKENAWYKLEDGKLVECGEM